MLSLDGPPKIGCPGPSAAKYVVVDCPPGPSMYLFEMVLGIGVGMNLKVGGLKP